MDLLTNNDRDDIFAAFADLFDTFFKYDSIIKKRVRKLYAFDDDRGAAFSVVDYPVRCLPVPDTGDNSAMATIMQAGAVDMSEGIVFYSWSDLKDSGLVDLSNTSIIPGQDTISIAGIEYEVIGVNPTAPLKNNSGDGYVLLKAHIKKKMKTH